MTFMHDRIRQLRESNGLSKLSFAKRLGIKRESVIQYEGNKCCPNVETLGKICQIFNVSADYFFDQNSACEPNKQAEEVEK